MKGHTTPLLLRLATVCCCVLLPAVYAESEDVVVGAGTVGDTQSVRVVSISQMKTNTLDNLWHQYRTSRDWLVLRIMIGRSSSEVAEQTDGEMCDLFDAGPTAQMALLLGICTSPRSRVLLNEHAQANDSELAGAARLALARRGDKKWEKFFLDDFLQQRTRQKQSTDWARDRASRDAMFNIEYIGSADCIMALLDSLGEASEGEEDPHGRIRNMRAFLRTIGVQPPETVNAQGLAEWWSVNRQKVANTLRDKGDRLPRLPITRVIVSSH